MPDTGPLCGMVVMRGSFTKVTGAGGALENYFNALIDDGVFERYLGGSSAKGIRFERFDGGMRSEDRQLQDGGLTMLLEGKDPTTGKVLKKFQAIKAGRKPQVRAYEIPINDSKELNTAAVAFDDVREAYMAAQRTGADRVKEYLADYVTVRLRDGNGGRLWVRPDEIMFASVTHFTSRDGDPQLHQHLELVNRARVGGKWYAIDSVKLFGMYENVRSVYETAVYGDRRLVETLREHGMSLDMDGRIPELGDAADVFGKRRKAIQERYGELVEQWRREHPAGRQPVYDFDGRTVVDEIVRGGEVPDKVLLKLKIQAWQETRRAKDESNTRVDYQAWNDELKASGYDLKSMLAGRVGEPRAAAADTYDAEAGELCALNAVNELSGMRSAWSMQDLEVAAYKQVRRMNITGTPAELKAVAEDITVRAARMCETLDDDPRASLPWMRCMTSNTVVECEEELKGRLAARGVEHTENLDLEPIAREYTLDPGQRKAMETICKGDPLTVVEGAAGAGKTHMLNAVKRYCDVAGRRLMLAAPMKKAAIVAHNETGADTCTIMKLLEAYGYRHDDESGTWSRVRPGETDFRGNTYHGVPDGYRMDADTLLVVDEAGMTDQEQALRLLRVADETGAKVTLMGDTMQKGAVGRGGVLAMAKRYAENSVDMADIHRFKDPGYAEFTLRLRDHSEATAPALARELVERGMVNTSETDGDVVAAIADEWMRAPGTTISTGRNEQANMVNAAVQQRRAMAGQLGSRSVQGMVAGEAIREGDIVMCRRNDEKAGVANRQLFTVRAIHADGSMTLDGDDGARDVTADYIREAVQLGYASTTYGAQGITSDHAIYWATPGADGADLYVAVTRGKTSNKVFMTAADETDALETLEGIIGRSRGDNGLDAARRALQEMIDQTSFQQIDVDATRDVGTESCDMDMDSNSARISAAARIVAAHGAGHEEPDPNRLARLEEAVRGLLHGGEDAAGAWSAYEKADAKAREAAGRLRDVERERGSIRDDLAAARHDRDIRPSIEEHYDRAITEDPAYTAALDGLRSDADRLALAGETVDGLRAEMRRLDARPAILRRLDAGKRTDTAMSLDSARRELDRLRREWSARWNETPDVVGHRWQMERIARENAERSLDPAGQAGRLKAELARIDADGGPDARVERLERRAEENAVLTGDLAGRHARAKTAAAKALARVPEWYRSLDVAGRAAEADTDAAIRTALDIPDAMERLERLEGLYHDLTGREFEPKLAARPAKPQAAATRPDRTAIRTPRTPGTIPEPEAGQYLPDPIDPADPLAMTMPGAGTGFGFGI